MADHNSLVMTSNVIVNMVADVSACYPELFPIKASTLTIRKIRKRLSSEGLGFLTKTLPHLRKSTDRALTGEVRLDIGRFERIPNTQLPRFLGELYSRVFTNDGWVRPDPSVTCIRLIRQITDLFYKYEAPYAKQQEEDAISGFETTDRELPQVTEADRDPDSDVRLSVCSVGCESGQSVEPLDFLNGSSRQQFVVPTSCLRAIDDNKRGFSDPTRPGCTRVDQRNGKEAGCCPKAATCFPHCVDLDLAKALLNRVLCNFDPLDIVPRHGPGVVSTGEKPYEKMQFKRCYASVDRVFPYSEYYYSSSNHLVDALVSTQGKREDRNIHLPLTSEAYGQAKVCLVPKDSRGPRLISCEPLEIQWIQQGIGRALVRHIEAHTLTRGYVNFTNQEVNQYLALRASVTDEHATLDLKEASDRVSLRLVRELWPEHVYRALVAARSSTTLLPDGRVLELRKFAPMGSTLCFPVMALTIWAIATACAMRLNSDTNPLRARGEVYVYGDDVITKTAKAADIITALESVGLLVNKTKSFLHGSFKESCGVDAYKGVAVQPVRIRTVWTSSRSASVYASYMSYSNSLYLRGFRSTANYIANELIRQYGPIPHKGLFPDMPKEFIARWTSLIAKSLKVNRKVDDEIITEGGLGFPCLCWTPSVAPGVRKRWHGGFHRFQYLVYTIKPKKVSLGSYNGWAELLRYLTQGSSQFTAGTYAIPRTSMLVRRWR